MGIPSSSALNYDNINDFLHVLPHPARRSAWVGVSPDGEMFRAG
ncbi:hypothetical protein [Mycobacterium marinum]